jgi:hypothetical protein
MDDYMFRSYVAEFTCVEEETGYLEIFNYTVGGPVTATGRLGPYLTNGLARIPRSTPARSTASAPTSCRTSLATFCTGG